MIRLAALQLDALRLRLEQYSRVQINDFLLPAAANTLAQAAAQANFCLSLNSGDKPIDLALHELATLTDAQQQQLTSLIHDGARRGFQYCFETCRLSELADSGAEPAGPLLDFYQAMNSDSVLSALRLLSADQTLAFSDAQITRYRPGHFLTEHDDNVKHKNRRLAFVLNLTPAWRADWGGVLTFHDGNGRISECFVPTFNTLSIFKVPQIHSVSYVTPFAGTNRISITGWIRRYAEGS